MPTPRLDGALNRFAEPPGSRSPEQGDAYSEEVVEGAAPGGQFVIRGHATATRAGLSVTVGDRVTVLSRRGLPFMIVNTQSRKGPGVDDPGGLKIVEELFLAEDENGDLQVWFRNATLLANLKLRSQLSDDPDQVRWGARGNSFFVRAGSLYHVFKFDRPGGLDAPLRTAPRPTLLRAEAPWTTETVLATVTYSADITVDTPCVWATEDSVQQHDPPFDLAETDAADSIETLSRGASNSKTTPITITQPRVEGEHIVVLDAQLDWHYDLILSLQAKLANLTDLPAGTVPGVKVKAYGRIEEPVGTVISEDGDPTAEDPQCSLEDSDPLNVFGWQAPAPDPDWHALVVNVTARTVIWSSALAAPSIAWTGRSTVGVGNALDIHAVTSTFPVAGDHLAVNGGQSNVPGLAATSATLPTSPGAAPSTVVPLDTRSTGERNLLDVAGLSWLSVPTALDRETFTSTNQKYAINKIGNRGTLTNDVPDPGFLEIFLSTMVSDTHDARRCQLLLYPVKYLPHRTKAGGDLLLFAVCVTFNDDAPTAQQFSLWRYNLDTAKGVAVHDWEVETLDTNFFEVDVIGATLRHVMWVLKRGHSEQRWTVLLSDTTKRAEKVLVDVTAPDFSTVPDAVTQLLAGKYHPVRPDALYGLEGAPAAIKNRFVKGWTATEPTLDPAHPAEEGKLRGRGVLKALGEVEPEPWTDALGLELPGDLGPSVRILESRAALGSLFVSDP